MEPRLYCLHETAGFKPRFCVLNSCSWISCNCARQVYQIVTFALPSIYLRQVRCTISVIWPRKQNCKAIMDDRQLYSLQCARNVTWSRTFLVEKRIQCIKSTCDRFCVNWEHKTLYITWLGSLGLRFRTQRAPACYMGRCLDFGVDGLRSEDRCSRDLKRGGAWTWLYF